MDDEVVELGEEEGKKACIGIRYKQPHAKEWVLLQQMKDDSRENKKKEGSLKECSIYSTFVHNKYLNHYWTNKTRMPSRNKNNIEGFDFTNTLEDDGTKRNEMIARGTN